MKRILHSVVFFCILFMFYGLYPNTVTAQTWQWAKGAGGSSGDIGNGIAVDNNGNSYVTGSFKDSSITFGTTTLTNAGIDDIFVVKHDPSGVVVWAKSAGGSSTDLGLGIAVDNNGNSYVTGNFGNSITFGTTTLTSAGIDDIFVVKYDPSGNVVWATSAGGSDGDYGRAVAVDNSGNSYVTGNFRNSITFGTTTLTSTGIDDIFVVKYDPSGNVVWAKSAGSGGDDMGRGIAADNNGNSYVTGTFNISSITFGTTTLTNVNTIGTDIFVVKYDPSGNVVWAKGAGTNNFDQGHSIAADNNGNSYVTGNFYGNSITFGTTTLPSASAADVFVVKYDPSGNVVWAKSAGGSKMDISRGIAADNNGNSYITGYFFSSSITFGSTTLTNASSLDYDFFVVKYNPSGNVVWAKSAGGSAKEESVSIAANNNGNSYVTGRFQSSSITFGTTTLTSNGGEDIFIAKLDALPTGIEQYNLTNEITVYPNPSQGKFTVNGSAFNKGEIEIFNMLGEKIVGTNITNTPTIEIDLSAMPPGIYFVKLFSEKGVITKKLVLE